jgi:hypothetical protein
MRMTKETRITNQQIQNRSFDIRHSGFFRHSSFVIRHCLRFLAILLFASCARKADLKNQVAELEKAFPTVAAPAQAQLAAPAQPSSPVDANACVHLAIVAAHSNDYAGGVIALQAAKRYTGVTAQQLMAIENVKQAMTAQLLARAEQGDAQAKAALAEIERSHSQ